MGSFSMWHWLILAFYLSFAVPAARIMRRTGLNPGWGILFVIPIVGAIAVWVFAWARWPAVDQFDNAGLPSPTRSA